VDDFNITVAKMQHLKCAPNPRADDAPPFKKQNTRVCGVCLRVGVDGENQAKRDIENGNLHAQLNSQ
jgi:hypothetical protein